MKNLLILTILTALLGCQKEFPAAPDYTEKLEVDVTVDWQLDLPPEEKVLFLHSNKSKIIYITKDESLLYSYVFDSQNSLIAKYSYSPIDLELIEPYCQSQFIDDWIQIKYLNSSVFINPESGQMKEAFDEQQNKPGSTTEYSLGKDNKCYYLEYTSDNALVSKLWDLKEDSKITLDTLETNLSSSTFVSYFFLGESEYLHFRNNFSNHVAYLKMDYEMGLDQFACSIIGVSFDRFFGSSVWNTKVLFRTIHYNQKTQPFFWDKENGIFLTDDKTLLCIDPMQQEIKWKRTLPDPLDCNMILEDGKLFFVLQGEKAYCLDANTGNIIWSAGFGYVPTKIDLSDGVLAISALRRLESDEILADAFNTLHLIDSRTGRELYRNHDPVKKGYNIPNDYRVGLTRSVAIQNDRIYLADQYQFLSFRLHKN